MALPTPRPDWTYACDANGNRTQSGYTNSATTYYDYNPANELCLSSAVGHNNCTPRSGDVTYAYDANGSQLTHVPAVPAAGLSCNAKGFTTAIGAVAFAYADVDRSERTQVDTTALQRPHRGNHHRRPHPHPLHPYLQWGPGVRAHRGHQLLLPLRCPGLGDGPHRPSGTLVDTYSYDPYGTITAATGTVPKPYRYAGGYSGSKTGLTHFGARYYDSTTGRWTQRDPSGRDANADAYTGSDPINRVDPHGLSDCGDFRLGGIVDCASKIPVADPAVIGPASVALEEYPSIAQLAPSQRRFDRWIELTPISAPCAIGAGASVSDWGGYIPNLSLGVRSNDTCRWRSVNGHRVDRAGCFVSSFESCASQEPLAMGLSSPHRKPD
ncbi:MAG: RHS repeat-associated core domain-containing protein [Actinobacteria bacterium]|nr:RHS repeat-associated core domain-containing protein [Actinomycetota bacterium]